MIFNLIEMVNLRICPKCKKPKLKSATNVSGWLAPDIFECTECGYVGRFYVEIDSEDFKLEEAKESIKNNKE